MKIGLYGINTGLNADREAALRFARTAEAANFESLWTGEHVVAIDPQRPPSPVVPDTPSIDTIATLALSPSATAHPLASGILLPQRNPVVLAKELAGIDVLSGGRLIFGVGAGYVKEEFDTMSVPFEERGPRTSEHIEVIRTLWTSDKPEFSGQFTSFSGIQSYPHPVQQPHPPIVIGGSSPPALRRTITQGNGWYGFMLDVEGRRAVQPRGDRSQVERPEHLGPSNLDSPAAASHRETVERFAEAGSPPRAHARGLMAPDTPPPAAIGHRRRRGPRSRRAVGGPSVPCEYSSACFAVRHRGLTAVQTRDATGCTIRWGVLLVLATWIQRRA